MKNFALPSIQIQNCFTRVVMLLAAVAAILLALTPAVARAAAFTPGNLVVYRAGSGSASLDGTATAVFLDEYTTSGTLIQSIAMPTTSSGSANALLCSGSSTSEGLLSRSTDGRYLVLAGYKSTVGTTNISETSSATTPRTVGRVDVFGNIDTSTALTDFSTASNPRSVASTDGTGFWVAGGAGNIRYTALGNTTSTSLETALTNVRQLNIFGGQLYFSTASGAYRVGTVGTGTPTTTGQTIANLNGLPIAGSTSYNGFFFADLNSSVAGVDTLYVAIDAGGITKYSFDGTTWTVVGSIDTGNAYYGLTASVSGTTVTIYASRAAGSALVTIADSSGYAGTLSGTPTVVASAAAKTAFRGVAFAPKAAPTFNLVSSANPSGFNSGVTFTANTILPADVTGTIQFTTNGGNLGSAVVISGGSAVSPSIASLPRGTTAIQAIYSGDANYLSITNTLTQTVTNHPPVANANTSYRNGLNNWKITVSDLLANSGDADGDLVTLVSLGVSTNGVTLDTNSTPGYVQYFNLNHVDDQFTYTVADGFGGTNTAVITLAFSSNGSLTGTNSIAKIISGNPTTLTAYGVINFSYITQRSTNIANSAGWVNVQTNMATNGVISATDHFSDLGGIAPAQGYYRIKWSN